MEVKKGDMQHIFYRIAMENDRESFNIFFKHYHSKLIRFAALFVPNYDQAEDIVSNVLTRILKNRKKIFLMDNFEGYLFRSIKNEAINFLKKEKRMPVYSINESEDFICGEFIDPLEKLISNELRLLVANTIEKLSPKRRMVYKLIKDEGLKYKEAGELLDISERTVEVHLKLAIREIREVVLKYINKKPGMSGSGFLKVAKIIALLALGI